MTNTTDVLAGATNQAGDPLTELVGEGKKFKDAAALAAGKIESDKYIEQLKAELAGLRKDLGEASKGNVGDAAVQALIERIEAATKAKNPDNQGATLSKEEIERLVKDGIKTEQSQLDRRSNYAKANAELLNSFKGNADQAKKHLDERATALGMTKESLTEMASTNPKMFRELFVPTAKVYSTGNVLPAGSTAPLGDQSGERGKSHYDKLRKELGNKFWDPAIQQQIFRDRKALGDKFSTI